MTTKTHRLLVKIPVCIVDAAVAAYCLVLAAMAFVSLTTAALWALLALAGYPLQRPLAATPRAACLSSPGDMSDSGRPGASAYRSVDGRESPDS